MLVIFSNVLGILNWILYSINNSRILLFLLKSIFLFLLILNDIVSVHFARQKKNGEKFCHYDNQDKDTGLNKSLYNNFSSQKFWQKLQNIDLNISMYYNCVQTLIYLIFVLLLIKWTCKCSMIFLSSKTSPFKSNYILDWIL